MRGSTVIEVRGLSIEKVTNVLAINGAEIVSYYSAKRVGWMAYEVQLPEKHFKIVPVPGYMFLGVNFSKGKAGAGAMVKWGAIHPQAFPTTIYKAPLQTKNITTEAWVELVTDLLVAGAECVMTNKRQFSSVPRFERYCDDRGMWRIIQVERGLNK